MAKECKSLGFCKATITEENGSFIITEYNKDDTNVYNLSEKLREWINVDGVSLNIKKGSDIPTEE